jgi:hypothetical protein
MVWVDRQRTTAIEKAHLNAKEWGMDAHVLGKGRPEPGSIEKTFDAVIDSDCFILYQILNDPVLSGFWRRFLNRGTYFMLCFSDRDPGALPEAKSGKPLSMVGISTISAPRSLRTVYGRKERRHGWSP